MSNALFAAGKFLLGFPAWTPAHGVGFVLVLLA